MKYYITLVIGIMLSAGMAQGTVHVRGYVKKDGTYVAPHIRSNPDGIKENNYSYPKSNNSWATTPYGTTGDYYGNTNDSNDND